MTIRFSREGGVWWLRLVLRLLGFPLVTVLPFVHSAPASTIPCLGDCAGDERVTVDELIGAVNVALEGCAG
jgi:hypothetical protein